MTTQVHPAAATSWHVAVDEGVKVLRAGLRSAALAASLFELVGASARPAAAGRARPRAPRSDEARYLAAEALLAADELTADGAPADLRRATDALLRDVLRSVEALDRDVCRRARDGRPPSFASARDTWLLDQVAALRVAAAGLGGGPRRASDVPQPARGD